MTSLPRPQNTAPPLPGPRFLNSLVNFIQVYKISCRLDHFKFFDDVTAPPQNTAPPLPGPRFLILRAKLCLWTKFHADWTILNFLMTS